MSAASPIPWVCTTCGSTTRQGETCPMGCSPSRSTTDAERIAAAARALDASLTKARAVEVELQQSALVLLCLQARAALPTAAAIVLEWSDQGDWLAVMHLVDQDGEDLEWFDEEAVAANLTGLNDYTWLPYMTKPAGAHWRNPADPFQLPIDRTLQLLSWWEASR